MGIFALVSLVSCIFMLFLANFVYFQNKKESVNIIYALYCLSMSSVAFCEFMYRQAENIQDAWLWLKISSFWPLAIALLVHFALLFTQHKKFFTKKYFYFLIYIPAIVLCIGAFVFNIPVREYWGYTYDRTNGLLYVGIISGFGGFFAFFLFVKYFITQVDPKKKKQAKFILIGQVFPTFIYLVTDALSPLVKIPEMTVTAVTIFAFFSVYAIWKYELFVINPATAAEKIISTMPDSLILLSSDLKILDVNNSLLTLLEYEREEVIGKPVDMFFIKPENSENPRNSKEKILHRIFNHETLHNYELTYLSKSGKTIPAAFSGSVIKDKQGKIAGIVGIGRDTRDTKRLQAQLLQSEKLAAIGQLAGGVAHEINNPMGVILGFAQIVARRVQEDDPLYMPLKSIERESVRCKKLIGDLLLFSRTGKTDKEVIDINNTIEETLSLVEAKAKTSNVQVTREYQNSLPAIIANKNQIQQVIVNLCGNAIDAMPSGGTIHILTKNDNDQIEINVIDTGVGISREIIKQIFDPFFTTKEAGKGTGLGLSLCYETISQHNGTIDVESQPGKGSLFRIRLPGNLT